MTGFNFMKTSRLLLIGFCWCGHLPAADLRLGIIGTDTSHVIAFAKALNDPAAPDRVAGAKESKQAATCIGCR